MEAKELINHKRIDLVVKYYYIKARETGQNLEMAREMYEKHIEAFTDGTFTEQGNKKKNSIDKYLETFHALIEDFRENGFNEEISLIPVGKDNEILDGAHRAACAIYFNKRVKVVRFPHLSVDYGFDFFKRRLLDDFYLDFIAKEYVNLKKEGYVMFVWPKVGTDKNMDYIEKVLNADECTIIYKKRLTVDKSELWNLIFQIYKDEHWIGYKGNKFKSVDDKRNLCYDEGGRLGIYILSCPSTEYLVHQKEKLRAYFGVEKASLHTTDTYEQSIEILDKILDKDHDQLLYEEFINNRDTQFTFKKHLMRKTRYYYRRTIDLIKGLLGRPV